MGLQLSEVSALEISRLDEPTKTVLKKLEGAAVYREWVERTRSKITELEQVVQRATPSHMNAYLMAERSDRRWWIPLVAACLGFACALVG